MENGEKSELIIFVIRTYYHQVRTKFPDKKEIFYLATTWALYAKFHHPVEYKNDDLESLFILGYADTLAFSLLPVPESIEALSYYFLQKEHILKDTKYEPRFMELMTVVVRSEEEMEKAVEEIHAYIIEEAKNLRGLNEKDFSIDSKANPATNKISLSRYIRLPSKAPFAWAIYYLLLVVLPVFGNLGTALAIIPWVALIGQIIYNIKNLIVQKPKFNLKKVALNTLLFVLIAIFQAIFKL